MTVGNGDDKYRDRTLLPLSFQGDIRTRHAEPGNDLWTNRKQSTGADGQAGSAPANAPLRVFPLGRAAIYRGFLRESVTAKAVPRGSARGLVQRL